MTSFTLEEKGTRQAAIEPSKDYAPRRFFTRQNPCFESGPDLLAFRGVALLLLELWRQMRTSSEKDALISEIERPESDLDLLVKLDSPPSILKFIELEQPLSDLLGIKVDLVMKDALKPSINSRI